MAEAYTAGLTTQQVLDLIAANATSNYVASPSTPMTVAQLISNYPPASQYLNQYARVSDLYGSVDDIMRCRYDGVNYRWVPLRPFFTAVSTSTSGVVNIVPLVTPPTLRLTGTLLGNMTVSPSSTNAFIGQQQTVIMDGTLGLFSTTIAGLIGSNLTLLGGGAQTITYGPTGWFRAS